MKASNHPRHRPSRGHKNGAAAMKLTNPNFPHRARLIVSAIRSEQMRDEHFRPTGERSGPLPFVTISRQAGAGGRTLARRLAERLNVLGVGGGGGDDDDDDWSAWDHELVEKVSKEYDLSQVLVEALEDARHAWVQDFLG